MRKKADKHVPQPESWEIPGSPDYVAVKLNVVGAQVALRPSKKKGQPGDTPDPYAEIEYAGRTWETALLRATQQPKWNEMFEVPIPPNRRNQLGELCVRVWDKNNSKKGAKGQNFLGEVRLPLGDYGGVNYEYVEPRRYKLRARSPSSKDDCVDGSLTLKIGMLLPKKKSRTDECVAFPSSPSCAGRQAVLTGFACHRCRFSNLPSEERPTESLYDDSPHSIPCGMLHDSSHSRLLCLALVGSTSLRLLQTSPTKLSSVPW